MLAAFSRHALIVTRQDACWSGKRYDGIQLRSVSCRKISKDQANCAGRHHGHNNRRHREDKTEARPERAECQAKAECQQNAQDATDQANQSCFDEKLAQYILSPCTDGHADANLADAFRDGYEHDVHHADTADDQRNEGNGCHKQRQRLGRAGNRLADASVVVG